MIWNVTAVHPTKNHNVASTRCACRANLLFRLHRASWWASAKNAVIALMLSHFLLLLTRSTATYKKSSCRTSCRRPALRCTKQSHAPKMNTCGQSLLLDSSCPRLFTCRLHRTCRTTSVCCLMRELTTGAASLLSLQTMSTLSVRGQHLIV